MISFNSQVTNGNYRIQFATDNYEVYYRLQNTIQDMINTIERKEEEIPMSFDDLIRLSDK